MPTRTFVRNLTKIPQRITASMDGSVGKARRAARAAPREPAAIVLLCDRLAARGRRDEAVREASAFLAHGGDAVALPLAPLFHRLGAADVAKHCYERARTMAPDRAEPLCGLAQLEAESGDRASARGLFEEATHVAPGDAQAWHRLGSFLLRERDLEAAEAALRHALELDPLHARAQGNLGLLLDLRGERERAEVALQRAVDLGPEDAENHFNLGALYAETGRPARALECFEAGIALQPDSLEGHFNAGCILAEQRRHDAALQRFARVLALAPGHAGALLSSGICHLRKGQHEKALKSLEAAARAGADGPRVLYGIAQAYVGLELPQRAVRVLGNLVARAPDHARAYRLLAMCHDKLGDRDRAREAYHRAEICAAGDRARASARLSG